jgi:hypothetical protein
MVDIGVLYDRSRIGDKHSISDSSSNRSIKYAPVFLRHLDYRPGQHNAMVFDLFRHQDPLVRDVSLVESRGRRYSDGKSDVSSDFSYQEGEDEGVDHERYVPPRLVVDCGLQQRAQVLPSVCLATHPLLHYPARTRSHSLHCSERHDATASIRLCLRCSDLQQRESDF